MTPTVIAPENQVVLSVSAIEPDPSQPRKVFDEEELNLLSLHIKDHGLKYPLRVRVLSEGRYQLIGGERRYRALKLIEAMEVSCIIQVGALSEADIVEEQLVDDLQFVPLNAMEKADSFQRLMQLRNLTGLQLAERLKLKKKPVFRVLSLLNLATDLQGRIRRGDLSAQIGYELAHITDHKTQLALVTRIDREDLTAKAITALLRRYKREQNGKRRRKSPPIQKGRARRYSPRRNVKVIIRPGNLDERATIEMLLRTLSQAFEELLLARGATTDAPREFTLAQMIELLTALDSASNDMQGELGPLLTSVGPLILSQLLPLFQSDQDRIRSEATELLNSLGTSTKLLFSLLFSKGKKQ